MESLKNSRYKRLNFDLIYAIILILYPMRHIHWGLDLWDTGYNYANFTYMGLEHMDPMWLFSTYLSNAVGHFLTLLPGAGGLLGMNFYTGLSVSGLAVMGYFFCTRKLGIPRWITFIGELTAVSLCWCPTALLYNYMTYVLFTGCVILLYIGLTGERKWYLFGAGVCLGCNVLVRFSNLPEAAMIVAVWAWDFIVWNERRRAEKAETGKLFGAMLRHTLWCLGGYLAALIVLFGYIQVRYGMGAYADGISRLFSMTENASDYTAKAMIMGLIGTYVINMYWVVRIAAITAVGILGFILADRLLLWTGRRTGKTLLRTAVICLCVAVAEGVLWLLRKGTGAISVYLTAVRKGAILAQLTWSERIGILIFAGLLCAALLCIVRLATGERAERIVRCGCRGLWCVVAVLMPVWLYVGRFFSWEFYTYGAMEAPAILFLMLAMLIGVVRIFHPGSPKEEKLISGMVVLLLLLTSIGSNNRVFPSINHLFLAAPYALWECWRFLKSGRKSRLGSGRTPEQADADGKAQWSIFPVQAILASFLALFLFQSFGFGVGFVFVEGTGAQKTTAVIENSQILKHIKMNPERARWMEEINAYVNAQGLQGREVILFGQLPALSYYLQMPSAFNPWSDLRSYSYEAMQNDMEAVAQGLETGGERPVLILERSCVQDYETYYAGGEELLLEKGAYENRIKRIVETEAKYQLIKAFAEKYNYDLTFENDKFIVME